MKITAQLDALVTRTLDEMGRLDVVVNNVGGADPASAMTITDEAFEGAFHGNVTTQLHLARAAARHLAKSPNGNVVNISALSGRLPDVGLIPYATARAAQQYLTRLLALEWAPRVRVNGVAVGGTETAGLRHFLQGQPPEVRAMLEAATPMHRMGQPEDIAAAVLYLASPAGGWVTGKILEVDGGAVASRSPFPFTSGLDG